jgi:hypothetical protein
VVVVAVRVLAAAAPVFRVIKTEFYSYVIPENEINKSISDLEINRSYNNSCSINYQQKHSQSQDSILNCQLKKTFARID